MDFFWWVILPLIIVGVFWSIAIFVYSKKYLIKKDKLDEPCRYCSPGKGHNINIKDNQEITLLKKQG